MVDIKNNDLLQDLASIDPEKFAEICFKSIYICSTRTLLDLTQIVVSHNVFEVSQRLSMLMELANRHILIINNQRELKDSTILASVCDSLVLLANTLYSLNEKTVYDRICTALKLEVFKLENSDLEGVKHDKYVILNLLKALVSLTAKSITSTDDTFRIIRISLNKGNSVLTAFIMVHIMPLINCPKILKEIWEIAWKLFQDPEEDGLVTDKMFSVFVLTCCLCDISFSSSCRFAVQNEATFWQVLQYGLANRHASLRKRAMYALKRALEFSDTSGTIVKCISDGEIIFFWDPEARDSFNDKWEDIILLLEVLEEKQVHVLKPVLVKMNNLIQLMTNNNNDYSWCCSWLFVVYCRMLTHETKFMIRWSISSILGLRFQDASNFSKKLLQFVCTNFLSAINDESVYQRTETSSSQIYLPDGQQLTDLLKHITEIIPDSGEFVRTLLSSMCRAVDTWSGVALFHVTRSLSQLPPGAILTATNLQELENMVRNSLRSQEPILRGAVQCNILRLALRLGDPAELNLYKLSKFFSVFKRSECFRRGTAQWTEAVRWLQQHFKAADIGIHEFCCDSLKALLRSGDLDETNIHQKSLSEYRRIARMFVLMDDVGLMDSSQWTDLLQEPLDWLLTAHCRPYLSKGKVENALGLCTWILMEGKQHSFDVILKGSVETPPICESILNHISPSILDFMNWLLDKALTSQDLEELNLFMDALKTLTSQEAVQPFVSAFTYSAFNKCCQRFEMEFSIPTSLCLWNCLSFCWSLNETSDSSIEPALFSSTKQLIVDGKLDQLINEPKNLFKSPGEKLLSSSAMQQAWVLVARYVKKESSVPPDVSSRLTKLALKSFQTASHSAAVSIFKALQVLLKYVKDPQLVEEAVRMGWRTCLEMRKNDMFRPTLAAFVSAVYQPWLMISNTQLLLDKFFQLRELGETSTGLFPILVHHCLLVWTDSKHFQTALPFALLICSALTFGSVHRKDQRVVSETTEFIVNLGPSLAVNNLIEVDVNLERNSRALCLSFLCTLTASNPDHVSLCCRLVDLLLAKDKEMSVARSRHFGNSLVHRVKNRCWQALVLLLPLLDEGKSSHLLEQAYESMTEECQQPSVRYLQEWLVARILMRWPHKRTELIPRMEKAAETRLGCAGSFLAVMVHLSSCNGSFSVATAVEEETQLDCWLRSILPWCMAQHFNTRLYARAAWLKLWLRAKDLGLESLAGQFEDLRNCLLSQKECGNTSKNVKLLTEDFYYTSFKADLHYSLETIFYEMPRLTHTSADEWIEPSSFKKCFSVLGLSSQKQQLIMLLNDDRSLDLASPANWMPKTYRTTPEEEEGDGHFQKKITPWTQMGVGDPERNTKQDGSQRGLVVVATLIDKVPNLGGLCRTCEIFGASLYVLPSLRHTLDKQFTGLSVTAEKWIPIKEVTPYMLKPYLLKMKSKGYTLVGAEQTTQSTDLTKFTFPKQTLLLLGNEREGLPVDLIHLLDVCVEIPQQGIIRSLNVHVSGALLIWEYRRQQFVASHHQG